MKWLRFANMGLVRFNQPTDPAAGGGAPAPIPTPTPYQPPAPTGTVFTQEDVTRVATTEHDKGERKARQAAQEEIAAKLGMTLDEAAAIVQAQRDADEKSKSEAQRAAEAAAKAKADAEADRLAAKNELHAARVTRALTEAGVPDTALAAITLPGVTADSTPEEIAAAVVKLKTDVPSLFTGQSQATPIADPLRPGQQPGLGVPASATLGAEGLKRFEARYPDKSKS